MNKFNKLSKLQQQMVTLMRQGGRPRGASVYSSDNKWMGSFSLSTLNSLQKRGIIKVRTFTKTTINLETGRVVEYIRSELYFDEKAVS